MLDEPKMRAAFARIAPLGATFHYHSTLPSTMDACADLASGSLVLAEHQTNGRGRFERPWVSAMDQSLCFSLVWEWPHALSLLSGFSLALGMTLARVLNLRVKWPNDLILDNKKCGGILIEMIGKRLVIGVGLNLSASDELALPSHASVLFNKKLNSETKTDFALNIFEALYDMLKRYEQDGFAAFYPEWVQYDYLYGQTVIASKMDGSRVAGIASGITADGQLLLQTDRGIQFFSQAEITLGSSYGC